MWAKKYTSRIETNYNVWPEIGDELSVDEQTHLEHQRARTIYHFFVLKADIAKYEKEHFEKTKTIACSTDIETEYAPVVNKKKKLCQNVFSVNDGYCRIIWQGEQLNPLPDAKTFRDIGGRLADPYNKWTPPVTPVPKDKPLDSKAKREISAKHTDLQERIASSRDQEIRELLEEELYRLEKGINAIGGRIINQGGIIWPQNTLDQKYQSFNRSIKRGIQKIKDSGISDSLTSHLTDYLLPHKYYNPPPDKKKYE